MDRPLTAREKMQAKMNEIRRQKGLPEQTYTNAVEPSVPSDPYILEDSADLKELPVTLPLIKDTTTVLRQKIFRKPENSNATYYLNKAPLGKYEKTEVSNLDHYSYFVFDNNGVKTNVNSIMPIYYTKVPLEPITAEPITAGSKKQRKSKRSNKKRRAHTRRIR